MTSEDLKAMFLVGGLLIVSFICNCFFEPNYLVERRGDYSNYLRLSHSLLENEVSPPYKHRLLFPALAGVFQSLGIGDLTSFFLVALVATWIGGVLFRRYLVALGFSSTASLAGAACYALTCGGAPALMTYVYPDALLGLFLVLSLILILTRRTSSAVVVMCIGVLVKEAVLFLPATAIMLDRRLRTLGGMLMVCLPVVVIYLGLRTVLPSDAKHSYFSTETMDYLWKSWSTPPRNNPMRWIMWSGAYSLSLLWLMGLKNFWQGKAFVWRMSLYLLMLVLPLVLATDTNRMLWLFFPVVIPLALCSVEQFATQAPAAQTMAVALVLCLFGSQLTFFWESPWKYPVFGLLTLLPLVVEFRMRYCYLSQPFLINPAIESPTV